MNRLIKNREIVEDYWQLVSADCDVADLPDGDIIVPVTLWQKFAEVLRQRPGKVGVRLAIDEEPGILATDLSSLALIAIDFPNFADGRGYSTARELRTHYHFQGEIRAIGDVLRDQLFLMERCGFDSFAVRADQSLDNALSAFNDFSVTYQGDAREERPLFRR
jgi:uncharacterized protein (DUF934 family)